MGWIQSLTIRNVFLQLRVSLMASLFLPGLYPLLATYRSDEDMLEPNLPTGIHPVRLALFLMIQTRNQIALSFSHHWGSYWIGLSPRTLCSADRPQDKRRQDQKAGPSRKTLCSADRLQNKRLQDQEAGWSPKNFCADDRLQSIGKFMKEFRSRLITYQCRAWTIPSYIGRFDKTSLSIRLRETM